MNYVINSAHERFLVAVMALLRRLWAVISLLAEICQSCISVSFTRSLNQLHYDKHYDRYNKNTSLH